MKSVYAVAGQMSLNLSNYVVFIFLTATLSTVEFIGFSTAVGLNILAYAIAEGGISFVAPKLLSARNDNTPKLASAFVVISIMLYVSALFVGYFVWNSFSSEALNLDWVIAYAVFFSSVLLLPSWLICWNITLFDVVLMSLVRAISVVVIVVYPQPGTLFFSGLGFLIFSLWFLSWLNRADKIIGFTNKHSLLLVLTQLKEVFFSKTLSYAIYSSIPLVIGIAQGNLLASYYIVGERVKALYSSLLQPFVQTVYLRIFQNKQDNESRRMFFIIGIALNTVMLLITLLILSSDFVYVLGDNFSNVAFKSIYIIAAFLSVTSSMFVYFYILPESKYSIFRQAVYFQALIFLVFFYIMIMVENVSPAWVLFIGEFVFLMNLVIRVFYDTRKIR